MLLIIYKNKQNAGNNQHFKYRAWWV